MTFYCCRKNEQAHPAGVRRTEVRFSGSIEPNGKLKLTRCVGKSFLDKDGAPDQHTGTADRAVETMDKSLSGPMRSA